MAVLTKITSRSLADNAVSSAKIQDGAIAVADVADGSISTAKLADDAVTTAKIANDQVTAAKIPAGAVVADVGTGGIATANLADDAVTQPKIGADAVTATELASNAVVTASIVDSNITAGKLSSTALASVEHVKPHIQPGTLYPAIKDTGGTVRLSDGIAAHSGAYGTAQSDGKKYYYTDIKGSKPIKDPRIGSYFGSQRYNLDSFQPLEQETATHGKNVFSLDGREFMRWCEGAATLIHKNDGSGQYIFLDDPDGTDFIEIVGFFSDANIMHHTWSNSSNQMSVYIDGTLNGAANRISFRSTTANPLYGRYVDSGSVQNLAITGLTTPKLHTLKVTFNSSDSNGQTQVFGIELIAQDTTSTATRSQIQIQPQNVVSYGKKFTVAATAPHYNPFAFKTDGTTAWASGAHNGTSWPVGTGSSANIDTATSLGLDKWLHSSNYYKPYNGGRVVKWIASDGTIKTSVTVMPPNARSINTGAIAAKANASVANDTHLPTFEAGAPDDFPTNALTEVAKTYHYREFGNGAGNQGTGGANYADASMLSGVDNGAFVMDDGLTSFSFKAGAGGNFHGLDISTDFDGHFTFIGTGFSYTRRTSATAESTHHVGQNLPYGTHIIKWDRESSGNVMPLTLDGVSLMTGTAAYSIFHQLSEVHFFQPKMPPIPEDAVVIADYMLMADYVQQSGDPDSAPISKGVRSCCGGRDVFADDSSFTADATVDSGNVGPWGIYSFRSGSQATAKLPYFGTAVNTRVQDTSLAHVLTIDGGSAISTTARDCSAEATRDMKTMSVANSGVEIGAHTILMTSSSGFVGRFIGFDVVSPIHTSSHYQTYETPLLKELVGGDRNMEQTNLVVTADGKTWDEVTRDTSYIGNMRVHVTRDAGSITSGPYIHDVLRGSYAGDSGAPGRQQYYNKDFAIAYDKLVCLEDGQYEITARYLADAANATIHIRINELVVNSQYNSASYDQVQFLWNCPLYRGDRIDINVAGGSIRGTTDNQWSTGLMIKRI